jgi:MFS family permease
MNRSEPWDVRYEWRAIALLTLGWGLVGLDRFAVNPLFPAMMRDLGLDYQDLGNIAAALSVSWGVAAFAMGRFADVLGRRRVLIPALLGFSAMAGCTGLANGITALLLMRAVMGVSEGAFVPASIAATIETAKPSRRGLIFGIQQNGLPVIGLGLGPVIVTQLQAATGSWRLPFLIVSIPGFIVAFLMYRILRETKGSVGASDAAVAAEGGAWRQVLRQRNVLLILGCLTFVIAAVNVTITMTPSYLVDHLKIEPVQMGFIVSATGLGGLVLGVAMPALSDRIGRKAVILGAAVIASAAMLAFMNVSAGPLKLFLLLGTFAGLCFGILSTASPLIMESTPASLGATAVGVVSGVGEIVGGGVAPAFAGYLAKHHGIEQVLVMALCAIIAAAILALGLREPQRATEAKPA